MHCGAGGSVAAVVADSVAGACVAGGSVAALGVVGASVAGGSAAFVAAVGASSAALGVVGAAVAIVTAVSSVKGAEEGVSICGADCRIESEGDSGFSPVSGCDVSPKRNTAAKTQTITAAVMTAYCHFFIS